MRTFKTAVILFAFILFSCQAFASENIRKISVTGKSEIVLEAQYAVITLGIREIKEEMSQSHSLLLKTISDLTEGLKKIGLSDSDIKKSLILQGQEYTYERNTRVLKGYYSECHIDLYVNKIIQISSVYKELANYQDITIRSTDFKRKDEFEIREVEFEKALKAAKQKAELMAEVMGTKIGNVHTIQEISSNNYATANVYNNYVSTNSNNNQAEYGTIKITALVAVEFELK